MVEGINPEHIEESKIIKKVIDYMSGNSDRVTLENGKQYTTVGARVEAFRMVLGPLYSIETEVLKYPSGGFETRDEETVLIKATIRNHLGRVLATGHAEEFRGKNAYTEVSAVEVCETSAIGRALAALGIHGGEYASTDEISAANKKRVKLKEAPKEKSWGTAVETFKVFAKECNSIDDLHDFWSKNKKQIDEMKIAVPDEYVEVKNIFANRDRELKRA